MAVPFILLGGAALAGITGAVKSVITPCSV